MRHEGVRDAWVGKIDIRYGIVLHKAHRWVREPWGGHRCAWPCVGRCLGRGIVVVGMACRGLVFCPPR